MVCIYCSGKTQVTNSRPQKRLRQTWRRRECERCGAVFSTVESADLTASLQVRLTDGTLESFQRDKLFMSIVAALGHRRDAIGAATALAGTITGKLFNYVYEAILSSQDIRTVTGDTLAAFDKAAAVQYRAYHPQPQSLL